MYKKLLVSLLLSNLFSSTLFADIVQAQKEIISLIKSGQTESVKNSLNSFAADYSQNPGLPEALCWIAQEYGYAGAYEDEKNLNQQIIQNYPGSTFAAKAKLGNSSADIRTLIVSQKYDEAKETTDKLIVDFNGSPDLPDVLYRLARGFEWPNKYEDAKNLFQQIVQKYPASSAASKAQLGVYRMNICSLIMSGQAEAAQTDIGKMMAEFSGQSDFPETLDIIAIRWVWTVNYPAAKNLYQKIIQQHPGTSYAEKAQRYLPIIEKGINIASLIELNKQEEVQEAIEQSMQDFSSHDLLPHTLFLYGDKYYTRAFQEKTKGLNSEAAQDFKDAANIWEKLIQLPPSTTIAEGHYHLAICYDELEEYEKAIGHYSKIADDYPDYRLAWNAQFMVGFDYEKMLKAEKISKLEANTQIKAAYQKVLLNYPDCKAAKLAKKWLDIKGN